MKKERKSMIFSNKELDMIEKRLNGILEDKLGQFANRVKPKLRELLEDWIPKKAQIKKLLKDHRKKKK